MSYDATQFLELADEMVKRMICLAKLELSSSFDHAKGIGNIPPEVDMVRTKYKMKLETESEDALIKLISAWPFKHMGYSDPGVDLEFPPMNVTMERRGGAVSLVNYSITLTGTCFVSS